MSDPFREIQLAYEQQAGHKPLLDCSTSTYEGCPQVCLSKSSWVSGNAGVTFHVWLDADVRSRNKVRYNIHALKMRELKPYAVTSRDFAAAFRKEFKLQGSAWPNVRVDFGPQNLMEGWIDLDPKTFQHDVLSLLLRFEQIRPIIDRLLTERTHRR